MPHITDRIYYCSFCIGYFYRSRMVSICPDCRENHLTILYGPDLYDEPLKQEMFDAACRLLSLLEVKLIVQHENCRTSEDLPNVEIQVTEGQGCAICISEYELGEKVKQLQCWHKFHEECLKEWLKEHVTCPLCRTNVFQ